jgi:hypothetical protein
MNTLLVVVAKVPEKPLLLQMQEDSTFRLSGVASKFSDVSSTLRLSYKRLESNKVANKQKKAPRQATLFPFVFINGGSK